MITVNSGLSLRTTMLTVFCGVFDLDCRARSALKYDRQTVAQVVNGYALTVAGG